ncbi:DUF6328 family protein [Aquihabitans daechungensis]|uniref:DUF6328 family protein n=1 Tax=Aquihabitans daechungensis TaxID=1052257 RepID=UPI003BA115A2
MSIASDRSQTPDSGRSGSRETEQERLNRELDQLLSELRVALPGIQVLLAFLLTVPFTSRFHDLETSAKDVYFGAVTLVAVASILLIAPTVHHRVRFRDGIKGDMIRRANSLAVAGTACLAAGLGAALYVAGVAAFPDSAARWAGPAVTLLAGVLWFALPFTYRSYRPSASTSSDEGAQRGRAQEPGGG